MPESSARPVNQPVERHSGRGTRRIQVKEIAPDTRVARWEAQQLLISEHLTEQRNETFNLKSTHEIRHYPPAQNGIAINY